MSLSSDSSRPKNRLFFLRSPKLEGRDRIQLGSPLRMHCIAYAVKYSSVALIQSNGRARVISRVQVKVGRILFTRNIKGQGYDSKVILRTFIIINITIMIACM